MFKFQSNTVEVGMMVTNGGSLVGVVTEVEGDYVVFLDTKGEDFEMPYWTLYAI